MRSQPYTVIVEVDTHEVHAESPLRAALMAVEAYKVAHSFDDEQMAQFLYACVFVGKTPDCIHNPVGMYCL